MIEYHPNSFAASFDDEELDSIWDHLSWDDLADDFAPPTIDASYLNYIREFHGGKPITTYAGGHHIDRFLNFANPFAATELDRIFNINVTRQRIDDRLDDFVLPFAALAHGNYLCFNYNILPRPTVVFWYHERPETLDLVAGNFDEMLSSLTSTP